MVRAHFFAFDCAAHDAFRSCQFNLQLGYGKHVGNGFLPVEDVNFLVILCPESNVEDRCRTFTSANRFIIGLLQILRGKYEAARAILCAADDAVEV